ncbi:hypothetical protein Nepgr_022298 [Nepenthes gracilis]|uniref:Kinesin motor domain-containing protein n=1 Tax=Nepenthes gracilis TaxID=150966 RepID=A0AAD3XWN8_NEPGR|nr:hypothetical protein Nepgr_022298 [Nepenthes gracilis]
MLANTLEIRNSSHNGNNVPDANLIQVSSTSEVINLMNLGQRNRAVGATALNDRSSRSHSCLTVHVQGRDLTSGIILRGCMHLVDLAGSERVDKSEVTGDRLKEAQHINRSLSALGDVIASLAQKNSHVPYRNSKLTQLLQDSLGGQAKTLMFVHISPEPEAIGETISTLKFAERVATVELGAARVNKDSSEVKELKEQIASLKGALARKEGDSAAHSQNSVFTSPERYRPKARGPSPLHFDKHGVSTHRRQMEDASSIEAYSKSASRQRRQSFDLDESLRNSPPWPLLNSPGQNYQLDDKEMDLGEWVDKVMVNKQEATPGVYNHPSACWEADTGHLPDSFYQKYFPESSKLYSKVSNNIINGINDFRVANTDDLDELDAATSDSSEPDLLWQFNLSKLPTPANGIESKTSKLNAKQVKSPELSKSKIPTVGPSPSRKLANRVGTPTNLNGRPQPVSGEGKRKGGTGK